MNTRKTEHIPQKFVYADYVFDALEMAYLTGENIILWGQGGFAKSEITNAFFARKGIKPYVKSLGSGTTIDALLGGVDLDAFSNGVIDYEATKKLQKETGNDKAVVYSKKPGAIDYLVENSFMNEEYVVFEEALDAPDFVLESLKDILTAGEFRNGTQVFPIKTKMIVICTNRDRSTFIGDNVSLKALMERFVMDVEVKWKSHLASNYNELFKVSFGKQNKTISYICEELGKEGTIISPRTAVKVLLGFEKVGVNFFSTISEFSSKKNHKIVQEAIKKYKSQAQLDEIADEAAEIISEIEKLDEKSIQEIEQIRKLSKNMVKVRDCISKIEKLTLTDDIVKRAQEYKKNWNDIINKCREILDKVTGQENV